MKLHRKKRIIILTAAAVMACSATVMAADNSLADQLKKTNSFYTSLNSTGTSASTKATSETTRVIRKTDETNVGPGAESESTAASNNSGSTSSKNGVIIDKNRSDVTAGAADNSSNGTLPSKKTVALSEQYYDDYEIYEEGIDGEFYFYTNVPNGGITDQSVYIDFPANVTYTAELNGQTITYYSQQPMTAKGTYVFRITAIYSAGGALSQQTEYHATFRFRIQDKVVKKETETAGGKSAAENSGSSYTWGSSTSSIPLIDNAADVAQALSSKSLSADYIRKSISEGNIELDQMADMLGVTPEALEEYLNLTAPQVEETSAEKETAESAPAEETAADTTESSDQSVDLEAAMKVAETAAGRGTGSGIVESQDPLTGQYLETLFTGTSFGASVQNGATVNGSVSFRFPTENTLAVQVTKNGESYDYKVGNDFTESGWYCMDIRDTVSGYAEVYEGKETPKFYFQIINDPVKDLTIVTVPQGEVVKSFTWNGREQGDHTSWVTFPYDGTYVLTYTTAAGEDTTVTIEKDSRPPKLQVSARNGRASIETDHETDQILVYRNGERVTTPADGQITGAGQYEIYATDLAGNTSMTTVKLGNGIGPATVIAVLLILILIGGGVGFVIHIKRNTSMR